MARCPPPPPPKSQLENRQATNRATAVIVPLILCGIVGYTAWVVIGLLSVNYLIYPHNDDNRLQQARPGRGIAIIVLWCIFFIPMAVSYIRVLSTVREPGWIEKGKPIESTPVKQEQMPERNVNHSCTNTKVQGSETGSFMDGAVSSKVESHEEQVTSLDAKAILSGELPPPPGTEHFYMRDVFACDPNGLPIWCGICCNWKPDRTHHGSDMGRCVLKLDHFCPWVGGTVAERNFNFFIQFNSYTAIFTLFILITMAVYIAEVRGNGTEDSVNWVNWIVTIALAALFTLFTGGMAGHSMNLASKNVTTIDSIDQARRTMYLAVLINDPAQHRAIPEPARPLTATSNSYNPALDINPWQGTITYPLRTKSTPSSIASDSTSSIPKSSSPPRTFAILRTHPGMNPWDLGALRNFKSVMGTHWYDWFLPLHHSPCCNHDRGESMYELGPDVERLKHDAGLSPSRDGSTGESSRRRRRHKKSHRRQEDPEELDIMGSTLANVNGVTGREDLGRVYGESDVP